ncbi:hypothetical protein HMPREF3223_01871 [Cutibacterium avidum]|nr:hypothetical protein HMPREF3223_01871 [Cutibacterium avidum]
MVRTTAIGVIPLSRLCDENHSAVSLTSFARPWDHICEFTKR